MGLYGNSWEMRGFPRLFMASCRRLFVLVLDGEPVDKSVIRNSENHLRSSAASSASTASRLCSTPRAESLDVEQVRVGDDRRLPLPMRQWRRSRSALIAQPAGQARRAKRSSPRSRRACALAARARSGASSRRPQWASKPGVHEHRRRPQRIAERPLARPFEHRIGEQQHAPAAPHPVIERDQVLGRLRAADAPSAATCPWRARPGSVDADRHDPIAALQAPSAPANRSPSSEKSSPNTSGRLVSSSKSARRCRPRPARSRRSRRSAMTRLPRERATIARQRAPARARSFLVGGAVVGRVGRARRDAELGQRLARLVGRRLLQRHC